MPIEIRELVIRATISEDVAGGIATAQPGDTGAATPSQELVNLCVEKVMEILKEKNDR